MKQSSRREFLKNVSAGGALLSSSIAMATVPSNREVKKNTGKNGETIAYRQLGSTGYRVSELGFGAMNTRNEELIHAAIDAGINYVDTAHGYMRGENERIVGRVMKTKRDKVFLVTKVHAKGKTAKEIRGMMETSLQRLGVDYVDCIFMHMPPTPEEAFGAYQPEVFEQAKKDGLCRFIGVSTHTNQADILNACAEHNVFDLVLVGYNYKSGPEIKEALARVRKKGIGTIGMKTQLKGKGYPDHDMGDISINQAALKWVLEDPNIDTTIPGMTAFEQLKEDLAVMDMRLSFNDRLELRRYGKALDGKYCNGVAGCQGCQNQCPKGVEICEINRCLGYAHGYGDMRLARENYEELPKSWLTEACADCDECMVKCVNGLNLTDNIRRAKALFA